MQNQEKYDKILDALEELLQSKSVQNISVNEIAQTAGIGKGSIYYYFPSKEAIWEALVARNYEEPLQTAKNLAAQKDIPAFSRMAMLFQACRTSSRRFEDSETLASDANFQELALVHQKYLQYLIAELKPELTEIIRQGIAEGDIHLDTPSALAEIVLIVLSVKLDNTLVPSAPEEIEDTISGLVTLLENGTGVPTGTLSYLTAFSGQTDE